MKLNSEIIIDGIHMITGIEKEVVEIYAKTYNIFDMIDHPMTISATDEQHEKLNLIKDFINSYQYLREIEAEDKISLTTPEKAGRYFISQMAYYREKEMVLCIYVDSKMHILSCERISYGTVNSSAIYPREVLKRALQLDCAGIILGHNHPSGVPTPSSDDIMITKRFLSIFKPLSMNVFDHFIVADNHYLSMSEKGMLSNEPRLTLNANYQVISIQDIQESEDEHSL
jgi:DNA repair protein RadC